MVEGLVREHLLWDGVDGAGMPHVLQQVDEPVVAVAHGKALAQRERRRRALGVQGAHLRVRHVEVDLQSSAAMGQVPRREPGGEHVEHHLAPFGLRGRHLQLHFSHHLRGHVQRDAGVAPFAIRLRHHAASPRGQCSVAATLAGRRRASSPSRRETAIPPIPASGRPLMQGP